MAAETSLSGNESEDLAGRIFRQKENFHRAQARLPVEEKMLILIELQKIALSIRPRKQPNDRRVVWQIS
jgi:hypothetical protein